jgi:two-component system, LytTR family, sensor kinase
VANQPLPRYDTGAPSLGVSAAWVTLIGCGAAAAIGTAIAAQVYLSMLHHGHSLLRMLLWHVSSWCFWGIAAYSVLRLGSQVSSYAGRPTRMAYVAAVGAALCGAHLLITAQLAAWIQPFLPIPGPTLGRALIDQVSSTLVGDVLIFGLLLAAGNGIGARQRTRALEQRKDKLEVELARAQLEALRLEIHPHFLFNTLNSIAALIRVKDHSRALDMLLGLSELMRATVDGPRDHLVPLAVEIDFVRRYVDLQQSRFADRLEIRWDIDDRALAVPVPTLFLQPLVENAIRHGAAPRSTRCQVTISARLDGTDLHVRVTDDGVGLPAGFDRARHAGTGLRNTGSRLTQLYGALARFDVSPGDGGGTVAAVTLPSAPAVESVRTIA